ncbi:hypothetical protein TNCV_4158901 [Trichonephila clavipes]|nr:hypothetical protein TNCV_4158901 [Trichonephila clavipes]
MYRYICPCSFDTMPQLIHRSDWHMVKSLSLNSHETDVFYWREIWGACRPGQQPNILRIKKGPYNTGNMQSCIILLKRRVSQGSNKGRATGHNTPECALFNVPSMRTRSDQEVYPIASYHHARG